MKPLGTRIGRLPVTLNHESVLEEFDGDRIVEYRTPSNDPYLAVWYDTDGAGTSRWLFIRSTDSDLGRYLRRDRSLRSVIQEAPDGFVYVVDRRRGEVVSVSLLLVADIPQLPAEDSLHNTELRPEDSGGGTGQLILIDGQWTVGAMSELERRYTQVSAFLALFGNDLPPSPDAELVPVERFDSWDIDAVLSSEVFERPPEPSLPPDAFTNYNFKGGWIAHHTFDRMIHAVPPARLPKLAAVHYASPGVLRFRVDPTVAVFVRDAVNRLRADDGKLSAAYNILHGLLLQVRGAREDNDPQEVIAKMVEAVKTPSDQLANLLGVTNMTALRQAANDHESAGHVLATYYRRLRDLYRFEVDDRARLV